ncbi:MAG: 2Fe-2S iron-sulfur cluster-binding protein [Candidatus Micrarchaeota archaeon]
MAKVRVKNDGVELEVPDGALILPYLWDNTGFPQACDDGSTPMCACVILKGEHNANPKSQRETETLHKAGLPNSSRNRLACLLRVMKGDIEIEY